MTYNIRGPWDRGVNAWENRRAGVLEVIRASEPDVLGTQEGYRFQIEELAAAMPEYDWVGVARDDGDREGEHCAIFYRREKLSLLDSGTFWLSVRPEEPGSMSWGTACTRICTWAMLTTDAGKTLTPGHDHPRPSPRGEGVYVANCHLDHISAMARHEGMRLVVERLRPGIKVLMGDWNEGEDGPVFAHTKRHRFVDCFRAIHPDAQEVSTYSDFDPNRVHGPKIDFVQFRGEGKVVGSEIIRTTFEGRQPSDHFPVTAELELPL